MPQMSPMNWFLLFMFFNLGFYLLMVKNFYFMNKMFNNKKTNSMIKKNFNNFEL